MKHQRTLAFDAPMRDRWAEIVIEHPGDYPRFLRELALRQLHRDGEVHDRANCPLCAKERAASPQALTTSWP
jgi:hypothetical protein